MTRARVQRPVRDILFVSDRQRVDVGTQRDRRNVILAATDVGDQPGALRQDPGPQPRRLEPERDPPGRAVLGVTDLWMGVQIPAELDQFWPVPFHERVVLAYQTTLSHPPTPSGPGSGQERTGSSRWCRGPPCQHFGSYG